MLNKKNWSMALAALCLVMITHLNVLAQGPERGQDRMEIMKAELGLTDVQATQLEALREQHRAEMRALRNSGEEPNREEMRSKRQAHKAELAKILSPEQMEKMKEMRHEHRGMHGPHGKGMDKESKKALRKLMKEQRAKLEPSISPADKAKIEDLRAQLAELRPEMKEMRKEMKGQRAEGEKPSPEQRAAMEPYRELKRSIMQEAAAIAKNYEMEIRQLHEEAKPEIERIVGDMERPPHRFQDTEQCRKKKHVENPERHEAHMAAKFILMDPNKRAERAVEGSQPEMGIFPNPSQNSNTVTFDMKNAGNVRVDLLSKDGQVVKTVFQGEMDAGSHSIPVQTDGLATDLYYYKVTSPDGVVTKRFTVAR